MPASPAKTFKALGILLWYPNEEWQSGICDICDVIIREAIVSEEDRQALRAFAETLSARDILELQEDYVDTFDRVRSLSLHLFEHVHGESRDRGQAMVDLAERYKEQGLALAASELPDYLPVFLEYLSLLPKNEALEELAETGHILAAVGKRLTERGSVYGTIFDSLTRLAGRMPERVERRRSMPLNFEQLDREWEDKPVDFLGAEPPQGGSCGGGCTSGCAEKAAVCAPNAIQGARP